jgi:hypothetical protein
MADQPAANPVKVYISYSHKDRDLLDGLVAHLNPLQDRGMLDLFYDRMLEAGADWDDELRGRLGEADIVLFLVSADSLVSKFVAEELSSALAILQSRGLIIIPLLMRPCDWTESRLARFRALPPDGRPVTSWPNRDQAFLAIAQGIRQAVESRLASQRHVTGEGVPGQVRMEGGHESAVTSIAVTADGEYAVSGSEDENLIVWDLRTLVAVRRLSGHTGAVEQVALTPDGRFVLSASWDSTVRVWDIRTGESVRVLEGHAGPLRAVAVMNDHLAISAPENGILRVWDPRDGRVLRVIEGSPVRTISVIHNDQRFITAHYNRELLIWDLETGSVLLRALTGARANHIAVTPDGRRVLAACHDQTVRVVDLHEGAEVLKLKLWSSVVAIAVLPDGRRAVSAEADGRIRVWDILTGVELSTFETGDASLSTFALIPNTSRLVCGSTAGTVGIFSLESPRPRQLPTGLERLQLAYLAVLEDPKLFPILETFDETDLDAIADRFESLRKQQPAASPPPLWSAWMQTVRAAKLGSSEEA